MPNVTQEYHGQINEERLYWKHKFYVVTEGIEFADNIIQADHETQKAHNGQKHQ